MLRETSITVRAVPVEDSKASAALISSHHDAENHTHANLMHTAPLPRT